MPTKIGPRVQQRENDEVVKEPQAVNLESQKTVIARDNNILDVANKD